MEFKQKQTIYLQIADSICDKIVQGIYAEGAKIPSIRNTGIDLQVNPNTVQRTYEHLQSDGVIYTQRGLGYFVAEGAKNKIMESRKTHFLEKELPSLFKSMSLLGIDTDTIIEKYNEFKKNNKS
jgi:DNA-binding transcriptional regulator YhcF (GntR family)